MGASLDTELPLEFVDAELAIMPLPLQHTKRDQAAAGLPHGVFDSQVLPRSRSTARTAMKTAPRGRWSADGQRLAARWQVRPLQRVVRPPL
jgi:hypothetical protein